MNELQARVRERVRTDVLRHGASPALGDPALFTQVDALLQHATERSRPAALLLPELLGEPDRWRLDTAIRYQSHRGGGTAALLMFAKRRLLMPILRWLFEYSHVHFQRQR